MVITLKLKSGLERIFNKNSIEIELTKENTLLNILNEIKFPEEKARTVLINGKLSNKNCVLHGGETVKIFPDIFGV